VAEHTRIERLGRNRNGYLGERLDAKSVVEECGAKAAAAGWTVDKILSSTPADLLGLTRRGKGGARVYLSAGIHGDEPAGPLAVRELLTRNTWPPDLDIWICPCLNPAGFELNTREHAEGADLNRQYLEPKAAETLAHIAWLERQPDFDLCLCLHEDWESSGFYLYEQNPDGPPSLAENIIKRVSALCPIDLSDTIEGRAARNGIIRPLPDARTRVLGPEAFYLITHKTRLSYTLEAPSDFPIEVRVQALVTAVETALALLARRP